MKFRRLHALRKTLAFGALHLLIAVSVGWLLTGSFVLAGTLALVEPLANTVAHYFFDRWWHRDEAAGRAPAHRHDDARADREAAAGAAA